jgi:hypothetical protein
LHKQGAVANVGTPHVKRGGEGGFASQNGKQPCGRDRFQWRFVPLNKQVMLRSTARFISHFQGNMNVPRHPQYWNSAVPWIGST